MSGEPEQLAEGTLISHLLELRDRLLRAFLAVIVVFVPIAFFSNEVFTLVAQPLIDKLPAGSSLIATSVISPFMTPFKLAFFVALFAAMPYVLYQVWAFVAPGLYRHEKRFALPLLLSSIILFYAGVAFAYFAVFPVMFDFFASTTPVGVRMMTDITSYMDFVLTMFLCFGLAFEVPVVVVLLVLTGLVKVDKLAEIRGYVLIGIFVIAAILTPPDAISQTIMAVPMYLLYEGGLLMARLMQRMRSKTAEA
ncbi:MAG: twin-arginine translocase subunit TatC [Gammaproteobacteria bacterium]|jgi:sec-independent protein translocase protein TatC|nr:twin-arginine translocase subunit TatC [Gammaproteobacteria bacterium]NBP08591.1 twin-arginine translocase subunit TatC [Gammaproteobacteria bacterium]NBR16341.1 twin-arginine translocase subunit TatC [Gammaproteobacteria bacterium]NCW57856.1 twin-arginine translocase subunit TatC [Gammaproteobacteria bacterium]NDE88076.1 twin-arginine translocase subunit TatC [Gammaproteobacteria bacterium]